MLAGFWPVWKSGTRNLRKFVPASNGITNFSKRLMSEAWQRCVPAKRPTEVMTRASEPYRINGQIIVVIARGMYPEAIVCKMRVIFANEICEYDRMQPWTAKPSISIPYFMKPTVYILFNRPRGVLYTGVTSDLCKRMVEHKQRLQGFTARYNVTKLGYCEYFQDIKDAIQREKQIKAGNRKKKIELIESLNPQWKDLFEDCL